MKNMFLSVTFLLVFFLVIKSQAQSQLLRADSVLCEEIKKNIVLAALPDSVDNYITYLQLDLDSTTYQLKDIKYLYSDSESSFFPNLKYKLQNSIDFGAFTKASGYPIYTVIVPVFISVQNYKGYKGNHGIWVNPFTPMKLIELRQELEKIRDHYYHSFYEVIIKLEK